MERGPYTQVRGELARCLDDLAALEQTDREASAWLQKKLSDEVFNLVAVGQFKRGKSSVINALIGEALLPIGVIPLTSVVTEIRYGAVVTAHVLFESGQSREVAIDALAEYITETHNPRNVKLVREVKVTYPSPWLESGVRLVDTPGIGSVFEHNTDVTQRYLPQADGVLFVGSVDQPMSRAELDLLRSIRPQAAKIFCLLNKTDYLSAEELKESLGFSKRAVETALGATVPIYPVSARSALDAKRAGDATGLMTSGFPAFEDALRVFMIDEKELLWLRSIGQHAARLLAQAKLQADLELAALAAPLEQVQRHLSAFAEKKHAVLRARDEYRVLIESNARKLLKEEIEPALERFKCEEQSRIRDRIVNWSHELRSLGSRKFHDALEGRISEEVRAAYDGWILSEEPTIARAFDRICSRFWSDIQATVNELLSYSAKLFNIQFQGTAQASLWSEQSGFTYKFWYEPVGLATITSSLIFALPKAIGGRWIVRQMHKRAYELIELHAGRIRHDFEERLKRNVAACCRALLTRIDATVEGIERAIDGGVRTKRLGEQQAARRRGDLAQCIFIMDSLEDRIKQTLQRTQEEVAA